MSGFKMVICYHAIRRYGYLIKISYKGGGSAEARRQPLSERSSEAEQLAYIQRWRGFESFRSDGFMTIIDFPLMAPVER